MAVRKVAAFAYLLLLLCSYAYLSSRYNLQTVQYTFEGNPSYEQLEKLRKSTKTLIKKGSTPKELQYVLNYMGSYRSCPLIMTTSFDNLLEDIPVIKGSFLVAAGAHQAVLGDKAADRLFRSTEILDQQVKIYGQDYKITGIIKNSDKIYISYSDPLAAMEWNKKKISFVIADEKYFELYKELLTGSLETLGLDIKDVYDYRQGAYLYINAAMVLLLGGLWRFFKGKAQRVKGIGGGLYKDYQKVKRSETLFFFGKTKLKELLQLLREAILGGGALFAGYHALRIIRIPISLIPTNLFSPSAYLYTFQVNFDQYLNRLESGISGIALEIHLINLLLFSSFVILQLCLQDSRKNTKKKQANSL